MKSPERWFKNLGPWISVPRLVTEAPYPVLTLHGVARQQPRAPGVFGPLCTLKRSGGIYNVLGGFPLSFCILPFVVLPREPVAGVRHGSAGHTTPTKPFQTMRSDDDIIRFGPVTSHKHNPQNTSRAVPSWPSLKCVPC